MSTQESFLQKLYDFFSSLKLTLSLLITLAITSIIGTIIPQFPNIDERYWATISESRRLFYEKMGFFDMYHSWWYLALLALFSANLIVCSIKRLPHVIKFVTEPVTALSEGQKKTFSGHDVAMSGSHQEIVTTLTDTLGKKYGKPVVTTNGDETQIFVQKNAWARLGVYVVHFSILVIMVGAIVGSIFGFKAFAAIVEGESISSVKSRTGKTIPLGFDVKCDQFKVQFYDAPGGGGPSQMPKEFKSILTLSRDGQEIPGYKNVRVVVNDPLTYNGITFYQASYGQANDPTMFFFTVKSRATGQLSNVALRPGSDSTLPDGRFATIVDLTDNPGEGLVATVAIKKPGSQPAFFKVFKNDPNRDELRGDALIFAFTGSDARMYTGLQVNKDPGSWIVWLGCFLMCSGLCVAFFMSHKRVWAVVRSGSVRIYGNASKNQPAFKLEFEALVNELKAS